MQNDMYKRLARMEALADAQRSEEMEVLRKAYDTACGDGDEEQAAYLVRKIRNKLLDASDKNMSLDRLGLDTTSVTKFLASLSGIFAGEWAVYRQALRDITTQAGFPYHVTFPEPPEIEDKTEV